MTSSRSAYPDTPLDATDVLVVGAGAAGLYAALCLPKHLRVALLGKDPLPLSASDWAQGGIAAAVSPEDSPRLHVEDTLKAGAGLCDREAVRFLAERAPDCIAGLVDLGVAFDRSGKDLALTLEAAHSRRRVLHAADTTGKAIVSILSERVLQRPNIRVFSPAFAVDLWVEGDRCCGALVARGDRLERVAAGAVVLATGGGGQVFAKTTNPAVSTGDGVAMAWRAEALLRDLEFVQFHPTALTQPKAPRFLISEAVRGEGARVVDEAGRRFLFDYHPAGELAPRDVVSRAIYRYLQATGDPARGRVWLDLREIPRDRLQHRFPNIIAVCRRWGIDLFEEPIPVSPAAHYWMGGIATDLWGRTSLPGLYAVGETASTGVHGANRLASNSLLECIVFAGQLAEIEVVPPPNVAAIGDRPEPPPPEDMAKDAAFAAQLRRDVARWVWQGAGICRDEAALNEAIGHIETARDTFTERPLSVFWENLRHRPERCVLSGIDLAALRAWGETRNLLDIALLILKSADFRTESRGGHYRSDFPETEPAWQAHTLVRGDGWSLSAPLSERQSGDREPTLETNSSF